MSQRGYVLSGPGHTVITQQQGTPGSQHTVVYQQQPTRVVQAPQRGLLGQLGREIDLMGRVVSREVDWCAGQVNKSLSECATGQILELFQTGSVVQLVSRVSGRSLQIVSSPNGQLILDGLGAEGSEAFNATWTVVNEGNNQVRLQNNNNYITIINGTTTLISMPPGSNHGIETKLQLVQSGQFVTIESLKERRRHVGVLPNGQLKSALATGKEDHAQFGVRLLYSPYGAGAKQAPTGPPPAYKR